LYPSPGLMPQLQNPTIQPPMSDLLNTLLQPSLLNTLLMLWICLLPAGIPHPDETVGNVSVVAPRTTWFETARSPITVPWESARPICHPVLSPLPVRSLHLHCNDTV